MNVDLSNAGLVGALLGLAFGLFQFSLIQRVIKRMLTNEAKQEQPAPEAIAHVERLMKPIRYALLVAALIIYPLAGYIVGAPYATQSR